MTVRLVNCPGKNGSPVPSTVVTIEPEFSDPYTLTIGEFLGLGIYATVVGVALAPDPFVVGTYESDGSSFEPYHAFRYNVDTQEFRDLGTFGGPAGTSSALGVNIDGTVVVGASNLTTAGESVWQAFRWTEALGMQNLGSIAPGGYSVARATSHDGTVVVGAADVPGTRDGGSTEVHAFRWVLSNPATGTGVFTDLGPATYEALAVNGDGSVIVGNAKNGRAIRWTQAGGVVDLGTLPGHSRSKATAVSADGKVVVGISSSNFITSSFPVPGPQYDKNTSRAFRWTQATGMRDLNTLLADAGVDLTGVTLIGALGLSHDGKTISGAGLRAGDDDTFGFSINYTDATTGGVPNHQGLWWNAQESGWGINFAHQRDIVFATWFTYGADNQPQWYVIRAEKTATNVYSGPVSSFTGLPFNTLPYTANANVKTQVGTATITFSADGKSASFAYTVNGIAQTKQIVPQAFAQPVPTCVWGAQPDLTLATNYQDLWWAANGSEAGWGINFTHQGSVIFATWFTYDANGKAWWLTLVAPETAVPKVYSGLVKAVSGPPFNAEPFDPNAVNRTTVGNATVTISDGNHARFDYTVNGIAQSKNLTRQVFAAPGTVCQ
jgi:probable HAF family extracellular repeat protein